MRKTLSGLVVLMMSCAAANAGSFSTPEASAPMSLIQYNGNSQTHTNERPQRPQRYVCVVPPAQSDNRTRPYVCRANQGRVGETCRCGNVVGSGRLDLDD
jgi:IMP cyclohydrolase